MADRLVQMTGPDGAVTTITYDLLGRKMSMNDPDMGAWSYTYDTAGNLVAQTDARNVTIGFG
ncbi:RHS repeat domain-containing protein [Candidatus Amarobacter glycogenicus]|uniref:RHS repeat domain-containing protein n=1 Tax=Candidatus Amarobacter glycogenicus TaxID=3140699 RepID=UPI0031CC8FAD